MNQAQKERYRVMGAGDLVAKNEKLERLIRRQSRASNVVLKYLLKGEQVPPAYIDDLESVSASALLECGL